MTSQVNHQPMCVICLTKFKQKQVHDDCPSVFPCDECLISIPLRHYKDLPPPPHECRLCHRPFNKDEFPSNNAKICLDCLHTSEGMNDK